MSSGKRQALILLSSLFFFASPGGAAAQTSAAGPKIGVVNIDKILHESKRTQASDKKLEELVKAKQQEREKMVSEIKGLREELVLLNEESRRARQQEVEAKMRALADFDRESQEFLAASREKAVKEILDEVEEVVVSYSKEKGLDLVVSSRAVLYGTESMDLTDPILAILNDRYAKKPAGK